MLARISVKYFPFLDCPEGATHLLVSVYGALVGEYLRAKRVSTQFDGRIAPISVVRHAANAAVLAERKRCRDWIAKEHVKDGIRRRLMDRYHYSRTPSSPGVWFDSKHHRRFVPVM